MTHEWRFNLVGSKLSESTEMQHYATEASIADSR